MALVRTFKVTALPGTPVADAIYYVKGASDEKWRVWVTSSTGVAREIDAPTNAAFLLALSNKQDKFTGQATQYVRGDGSLATFNKAAIGLPDVENYSAANMPLSTAAIAANLTKANEADVLHKNGGLNETANGIKTFAASPVVPNATTASQAAAYGQLTSATQSLQTQIDNLNSTAASGLKYKGGIDASTNPNYPAATVGDVYIVTATGKIGGPAGIEVQIGDTIIAKTTTVAGTQSTVGVNWNIIQSNIGAASETVAGYIRKATLAEAIAGTFDDAAITPLKMQSKIDSTAIKFDAAQALSNGQKAQALANIGALSNASIAGTNGKYAVFNSTGGLVDGLLYTAPSGVSVDGQFMSNAAPAAGPRGLSMMNGGVQRWSLGKFGAESGSDAGSDFTLIRFNDAGSNIGTALSIARATGNAAFSGTVSGATPVNNSDFVTKAYADAIAVSNSWGSTDW